MNHGLDKLIFEKKAVISGEKIILPEVSNGLYSYSIAFENDTYMGKLNIMQSE